ncbi:sensor domain-containing diguanylate cyclase [Paraburkholderia saeva]|uniref:sensor domain-containing diguanylate cyclase n=1 Tax=Paraburkholderia saeva TaxID=2777537 RepID=UPI001DB83D7F|nr:sensor domain-containing diguanylate cyclase [Paraburkholderia saeva]CAG4896783.1 hypothetical protein R70241_02250 [Paraburkholderia saeva]
MQSNIMSLAATGRHRIAAGIVAGFMLCVLAIVLPMASASAPNIAPFMPMFAMAVFAADGLTAYLLWTQFMITRQPFLAALAGAYIYTAVTVVVQILVFPGVFSPTGLLGAGPQTAAWIWVFWHAGFPLFVAGSLVVYRMLPGPLENGAFVRAGCLLLGTPVCLSLFTGFLAIHAQGMLPDIVVGRSYREVVLGPAGISVATISALALAWFAITTRLRTLLQLWIAVALVASLADVSLTMAASERFSVGWYVGRLASVMASSALLGVLIWEIANLYRALHAANIKLGEYAVLDGLTGIFNRRYFDQRYPAALRQANETGRPLAVLMVDIDRFKSFNDHYGHQRGDECLIAVAHALKGCLRRTGDFVARYGGEEFVIVLPECNQKMAGQIAETLRDGIEALGIEAHFTEAGHVTVSIGLAASCGTDRTIPATLLAEADAALYRAKLEGRNRVAA